MARESRARTSGRRVSYSYKDAFKDLDISDSASDAEEEVEEQNGAVEDDPDDFMPPADDEDDAEEFVEDGGEYEDGDEDYADAEVRTPSRKHGPRGESIVDGDSDIEMESALGIVTASPARPHKTPQHGTRTTGISSADTPGAQGAKYVPLSTRETGRAAPRQRAAGEWREGGQELRLRNLFGPTNEDLRPVFDCKRIWLSQDTLPSRLFKHLTPSPYVSEHTREKEAKAFRKWYEDAGREAFARGQQTRPLSESEVQPYLINSGPESLNLLMGGVKERRVYTLNKGEFMSASTPFGPDNTRKGWILHLGSRIQDAQWAPNEQGATQYLAVTVEQKNPAGEKYEPLSYPKAPAFTETKPFPASIQIWAFQSTKGGSIDLQQNPRLAYVICTDWGAPKTIKWCVIGTKGSVEQSHDGMVHLGLLASIWSDGKVRMLDVSFPKAEADSTQTHYMHYSKAALELGFSDTLATCLSWLSPTAIAVGTASGIMAIWTISRPEMFPSSNSPNTDKQSIQPWFHKQLSDTYIITVCSGWPSRPHLISMTIADGFSRLIDLRSPLADGTSGPRGRMLAYTQAWHEHTQSFVMVDEYYMLKNATIRRYHQAIYTFRTESTITACAASPVHPAMLVGSSDGSVAVSNGLCKMLNSKELPWSQMWFKHEWRRPMKTAESSEAQAGNLTTAGPTAEADPDAPSSPSSPSSADAQSSPTDPAILSNPLVRISEGYKPVQNGLQYPDPTRRPQRDGTKYISIFEENSAPTRVAWNPNLKFGTWAVAGMQSGLLRVEDLGV